MNEPTKSKEESSSPQQELIPPPKSLTETLGEKGAVAVMAVVSKVSQYRGPLPQAEQYKIYEEAYPGSAEKILEYMSKEQAHRQEMDKKIVKASTVETILGQIFAFIIMAGLIVAATFAALNGHESLGCAFMAAAALGVVRKFIDGKSFNKSSIEETVKKMSPMDKKSSVNNLSKAGKGPKPKRR